HPVPRSRCGSLGMAGAKDSRMTRMESRQRLLPRRTRPERTTTKSIPRGRKSWLHSRPGV
ncbi:hypothetical protein BGX29_008459, partial [Mortierella sp. GBA35]